MYVADNTLGNIGDGIGSLYSDLTGKTQPAWLPSSIRGEETIGKIVGTAKAIRDNPSLIWKGIKAPYVEA